MWCSTIGSVVTLVLGLLALPFAAEAQQPAKLPRIGYLLAASPAVAASQSMDHHLFNHHQRSSLPTVLQ